MNSLRRNAAAFALASVLAGVGAALCTQGPTRLGVLIGLGVGAVSGAMALGFVAASAVKSTQAALMAVVTGFLVRMVLVAASLLLARALGGDLLACALGFFALYVVGQGLEIALVSAQERRA
jgi:hypothetical protein